MTFNLEAYILNVNQRITYNLRVNYLPKEGRIPSPEEYLALRIGVIEVVHFSMQYPLRPGDKEIIACLQTLGQQIPLIPVQDLYQEPNYPLNTRIAIAGSVEDVCVEQRAHFLQSLRKRYVLFVDLALTTNY